MSIEKPKEKYDHLIAILKHAKFDLKEIGFLDTLYCR